MSVTFNANTKFCVFHFFCWFLFHKHSRITRLQGKGEGVSLTPHYHFYLFYRHLDISRAITAESSRAHLCTYLAAELKPRTLGFLAQVAKHQATHPQLFHDGDRYYIETSPLICDANQWTDFYMILASVVKELSYTPLSSHCQFLFRDISISFCCCTLLFFCLLFRSNLPQINKLTNFLVGLANFFARIQLTLTVILNH